MTTTNTDPLMDAKIALTPEEYATARTTAAHEAGHFLVADRCGLKPSLALLRPGDGYVVHEPGDPARSEATAWAGIMAEDLLSLRSSRRKKPSAALSEETLDSYVREVTAAMRDNDCDFVTACDRSPIAAFGPETLVPWRVFETLRDNADELQALADYALELFTPVLVRTRGLDFDPAAIVKAAGRHPVAPKANSATERLAHLALAHKAAKDEAESAASKAFHLNRDVERVWPHTTALAHRKLAEAHYKAAVLFLEALEAAKTHNEAWADEFAKCLAAGDEDGARQAARSMMVLEPVHHKRAADRELDKMVRQRHRERSRS